jgi:hypothetical protein
VLLAMSEESKPYLQVSSRNDMENVCTVEDLRFTLNASLPGHSEIEYHIRSSLEFTYYFH